jgi:hypothetical protein
VCPENSTRWLASCLAVINEVLYEYYQRSKTVYRLCTDWMVQEKEEHTKHRTLSKTGFNFRITASGMQKMLSQFFDHNI